MNTVIESTSGLDIKDLITRFLRFASLEIAPHEEPLIPALARAVLPNATVYVAHTPKWTLQDVVRVALNLEKSGVRAAPHIVARRIENEGALRDAARRLADGGVERALVISGDTDRPAGPYSCTLEVLQTLALTDAGIRRIDVAGHPEGHRAVPSTILWQALRDKQDFAACTGTEMRVITQFGFDSSAICNWVQHCSEQGILLPVCVGLAGPAPLAKLIAYAVHCGIGTSLRGALRNTSLMRKATGRAASAEQMVTRLVTDGAAGSRRIVGAHLFSFGGAMATARLLRAVSEGNFEMLPGADGFAVTM